MDTKMDDLEGSVDVNAWIGWLSPGEMGCGGKTGVKDVPSKTRPKSAMFTAALILDSPFASFVVMPITFRM